MSESRRCWQVERVLSHRHPSLPGHFPTLPVFPGVVLLAEVLEAVLDVPELATRFAAAPRVDSVKFLTPVLPAAGGESRLELLLTESASGVDFELRHSGQVAVRGQLRSTVPT